MFWYRIFLFSLVTFSTSRVEADQDPNDDVDLLFWKTVNDGPGFVSVYENVDLQASSFLAVCLGYQYQRNIPVDGEIFLKISGSKIFEWKSHYNSDDSTESYSRLQCYDSGSTCYKTEESKCTDQKETLPFGHCEKDMSMIINQQTLTISCGDEVVKAERCSEGNDAKIFNITVKEFRNGVCATRIRPIKSSWIDVLSGDSMNKTIDFKSHSLMINQLMIRESNPNTTLFYMNFHAVDSKNDITETDVMNVTLQSNGTYIHDTYVTVTATVCNGNTSSEKFYVKGELGKTQIQITLVGDQVAFLVSNISDDHEGVQLRDTIWLPSCNLIEEELMMSFEDDTSNRNTVLISNTNIKIVEKGKCSEPNVTEYGLNFIGQEQTEEIFRIGSEIQLDCLDPMYEIEGNNIISCQLDKTWTPDEFPVCKRKTCDSDSEDLQFLDDDGNCRACTVSEDRCEVCAFPSIDDIELEVVNGAGSDALYTIGSEVELACKNPMNKIMGSAMITCDSTKNWLPKTFPSCIRKTCPSLQYLGEDGTCHLCSPETDSEKCGNCTEPNLEGTGLTLDNPPSLSSYLLGSEIKLVCEDPKLEIGDARNIITCQSNNAWLPSDLIRPCTRKLCNEGEYLTDEGKCTVSDCPKGQYTEEGTGECLFCKSKGDKFYSDTVGSADCKVCDGEVDSGRAICLQRDPNSLPPNSKGDKNTRQIVYIIMGVVAFIAHLTAFWIAKCKQSSDSSSGQNKGSSSDYFFWRVKKYDSTKISHRKFSNRNPESSGTLERQASGKELGAEAESCKTELGNNQPTSSAENNEINDSESAYIGISEIPFPTNKVEESGYEDVTLMPLPPDKISGMPPPVREVETSGYEDVSLMPLPPNKVAGTPAPIKESETSGYEDVSLMPLPPNKISATPLPTNEIKMSTNVFSMPLPAPPSLDPIENSNDLGESVIAIKNDEIKDGTKQNRSTSQSKMNSSNSKNKSETLENDLNRKEKPVEKAHNSEEEVKSSEDRDRIGNAVEVTLEKPGNKMVINLEKEFAELDKLLQYAGWTASTTNDTGGATSSKQYSAVESTPNIPASSGLDEPTPPTKPSKPTSKPTSKQGNTKSKTSKTKQGKLDSNDDEADLSVSYSEDVYAVMEYTGEPIQLYETMSSAGTLKTYNHIAALSKKDADGVERYVPLGVESEEGAIYTRSSKQADRRADEGDVAYD